VIVRYSGCRYLVMLLIAYEFSRASSFSAMWYIINRTSNYIRDIHPFTWASLLSAMWHNQQNFQLHSWYSNVYLSMLVHMFVQCILVHHLFTLLHLFVHVCVCRKFDAHTLIHTVFHLVWGLLRLAPISTDVFTMLHYTHVHYTHAYNKFVLFFFTYGLHDIWY